MIRRFLIALALVVAPLTVATVSPAAAADFTVNSNGDAGDANLANPACATVANVCTLRAAVEQANSNFSPGPDVITVPAMTIGLSSQLTINSNLTIKGAGARNTILQATGGPHGMLFMPSGIVTVSGVTITGATGGGALGVWQQGGALTLEGIRVTNNTTSVAGVAYGPVYTQATMVLRDSEISGNSTTSTSSNGWGGGLSVYDGTVTVINSTIVGNTVAGAQAGGGGVSAEPNSTVSITSSTIAGNTVSAGSKFGAGIYQKAGGTGSVEVSESVVSNPVGVTNCSAGGKMPVFLGKNLLDDTSCGAASATRTIAPANLAALADNGGQTNTRVPAVGSPAINAASTCATSADQRGQSRPIAGACDLGAAEVGADREAAVSVSNASPAGGSDIVATATARNNGLDQSTGTALTVTAPGAQVLSASLPGGSCSVAGDTATCALGTVVGGTSAEVVLSLRMPSSGAVVVTATIGGDQPDPVSSNNSATATSVVGGTQPAQTACAVVRNGNAKANVLQGTPAGDRINGRGGNDRINGKGGRDCLNGGAGKDKITGGAQADTIKAGPGNDTVFAKDGTKDRVDCGSGRDRVIADKKDKLVKCEVVRRR